MRDADIRRQLNLTVMQAHRREPETRVIEELSLCRGEARVDIAVVNGELSGFEIKSARDTLSRLPQQAAIYSSVFDRVTIVVSERHREGLVRMLPDWWGVWIAEDGSEIRFHEVRPSRPNPDVLPLAIVQLLWREEALSVLEKHQLARGVRSKSKEVLWKRLSEHLPLCTLKTEVRQCLKTRANWRVEPGQC